MTIQVLCSRSNIELTNSIVNELHALNIDCSILNCQITQFANTEINIKLEESVRDKNIYIISSGCASSLNSINDYLMELILLVSACQKSSAKNITVIVPCFPYSRSDKKDHRGTIASKVVIDMLTIAGSNRIICMDLHAGQIQGMSNIPFDNLYGIGDICKYLNRYIFQKYNKDDCILVSPDAGGIKRTKAYALILKMDYMILEKQRNYKLNNVVDKVILIGEKSQINNKICIMIDDMIDTAGTMIKGATELMNYNAKQVIFVATHGILSNPALQSLNSLKFISDVIVTNTISQENNKKICDKIHVVDVGFTFASVITILEFESGESISEMFEEKYILEHI